jgi:lysophospholipase L1-like esterase
MKNLPSHCYIVVFLIQFFCSACSESYTLEKLPDNATILAFGDSLTYGTGASSEKDYPSVLAELTELDIINAGIPGEISAEGDSRLPALLDQHQPELLILMHGGNDILRKIPAEETQKNLNNMIRAAKQRGIAIILLGIPQPGLLFMDSAEIYQLLAETHKIPADLETIPFILGKNKLKSDLIHPNDNGYQLLAENILQLLQETGAI